MKNVSKYIPLIFVLIFAFSSCSTDFDLTADYKEVAIVYGLLNQKELTHYIRIHKGYLDEETSALEIAKNPDSIYYPDILNVTVEEINTGKIYTLERVNGDTLTPPLTKPNNGGPFPSSPNILYRFNAQLNPNSEYRLRVENTQTGYVVASQTELVHDFVVNRPFPGQKLNFANPDNNFNVIWQLAKNSMIYDLTIRFNYYISDPSAPNTILDSASIEWELFKNREFLANQPEFEFNNKLFYQFIQRELDPVANQIRQFKSVDYIFYTGTPTLARYINFTQAQTGITENNTTPAFTNIENGLGIFTSRYYKEISNLEMTDLSIDSLACGTITGDLNFAPSKNFNAFPNWPYCN